MIGREQRVVVGGMMYDYVDKERATVTPKERSMMFWIDIVRETR